MKNPVFEGIIGHETILTILNKTTIRPHGAYLFSGPAHVGKHLIAERFAHLLLKHSIKTSLDAHPDFIRLSHEEGSREIVIKQTRALLSRMQLTSARGGYKIALINEADRLNEESCNALLKAVEEPTQNEIYLFITEDPERLPATLRSRLTHIQFYRVPATTMASALSISIQIAEKADGKPGLLIDPELKEKILATNKQSERVFQTLLSKSISEQCAVLETVEQSCVQKEDVMCAWKQLLVELMHECSTCLSSHPQEASRIGNGLIHAWHLAHTNLSPRLAIEWSAIKSYIIDESIPSFLQKPWEKEI